MLWIRIDERLQSSLSWWSSNRNEQGHRMQDPENVLVRESTKYGIGRILQRSREWQNPTHIYLAEHRPLRHRCWDAFTKSAGTV